jgi:glycosyltransferase involved in cell wall biosynthesis
LWDAPPDAFEQCPFFMIGPLVIQFGLVRMALRPDIDALIILGAFHWPMNWIAAIAARMCGKPVYFWTHGWTRAERGLQAWLRNTFYRIGQGLLLYGPRAKAIGISQGLDARRLHVIYNSLDYQSHLSLRKPLDRHKAAAMRLQWFGSNTIPVVACCSRLTRTRRLDLLFAAAAQLQSAGHPVAVLLIGDGPERELLEKDACDLKVPTRFYGACYDEHTLYELISACNVTVAPGQVGLTAIQSLSFGTPVITHGTADHQMPEFEAIVPGITGEFFTEGSVDSLAGAIKSWTATPLPDERTRAECFTEIDRVWNPGYQVEAIERALDGLPAASVIIPEHQDHIDRRAV